MSPKLFFSALVSVLLTALVPYVAHAQTAETAAPVANAASINEGEFLYSADDRKVAAIYRVYDDGRAGVIVGGKLIIVPAATIQNDGGRIKTTLSYRDLMKLRS